MPLMFLPSRLSHIQTRQTNRHQRWRSHPGEKDIIVNQEWKNEHFNVITDNEALALEIELQNGEKVILATIYCPNGNPSSTLKNLRGVKMSPLRFFQIT